MFFGDIFNKAASCNKESSGQYCRSEDEDDQSRMKLMNLFFGDIFSKAASCNKDSSGQYCRSEASDTPSSSSSAVSSERSIALEASLRIDQA